MPNFNRCKQVRRPAGYRVCTNLRIVRQNSTLNSILRQNSTGLRESTSGLLVKIDTSSIAATTESKKAFLACKIASEPDSATEPDLRKDLQNRPTFVLSLP